jgi:hypothetical protein
VKRLAATICLVLTAIPAAASASPAGRAAAYLEARQDASGCVGSWQQTGWVAIGLKAAGHAASAARAAACVAASSGSFTQATDVELAIMAAVAGGQSPRAFGGRNLVHQLAAMRHGGYYAPSRLTNSSIFGVLALRAAGRRVPRAVVKQIVTDQSPSGGWDFFPDGDQVDMTAAGVEALRAAGYSCSARPIRRAVRHLHHQRRGDGGFAYAAGQPSNSQSTAWVVQAYAACGQTDRKGIAFLEAHQGADGGVSYGPGSVDRAWVTAQAAPAFRRRALPIH